MKEVFNNNLLLKNNLKKLVKHYINLIFVNQGESTFPTPPALIILLFFYFNLFQYTRFKSMLEKNQTISVTILCKKKGCIVFIHI